MKTINLTGVKIKEINIGVGEDTYHQSFIYTLVDEDGKEMPPKRADAGEVPTQVQAKLKKVVNEAIIKIKELEEL